jgi:hypothetical protein
MAKVNSLSGAAKIIYIRLDDIRCSTQTTEEEGVFVSVILHKRVLETEGESDKTAVTIRQSQEPSAEEVLRVGHVSLIEDREPLFTQTDELVVRLCRQFLEIEVFVQASGVFGVAIDLSHKIGNDPQLGVVAAEMDIEVFDVVLCGIPETLGVVRDVVCVLDDGGFAVLRAGGAVEVEAVEPDAGAVE